MNRPPSRWVILILSFQSGRDTARIRLWRALKALGAATLRDGVYLLPERPDLAQAMARLAGEVRESGGQAFQLAAPVTDEEEAHFRQLFDRDGECRELGETIHALTGDVDSLGETELLKRLRQIRRDAEQLRRIDFFPGPERSVLEERLTALETAVQARLSPHEPSPATGQPIPRLSTADYQGCTWATRASLWVDRVASAWLIRRFIDPKAELLWLASPADCPAGALGFDFDGATFSHVDNRVTFQVLTEAFSLDRDPALVRLGELVRCLDTGGIPVPEAAGFEAVLIGAKQRCRDDDALLTAMTPVLDDLHRAFSPPETQGLKP